MQQRPKWLQSGANVELGKILLIKDENRKVHEWPLGRVIEVHPGKDGLVRVVTLRTEKGMLKRPIAKLSPLPVEQPYYEENEEKMAKTKINYDLALEKKEAKKQAKKKGKNTPVEVRRSPRFTVKPSLVVTLLIGLVCAALADAQSVHQFQHQPGLHFKDEGSVKIIEEFWTISVQQNTSEFNHGIRSLQESINVLNLICSNATENCHTYLDALQERVTTLDTKLATIRGPARPKRAVPLLVVGAVAAGTAIIGTTVYFKSTLETFKKEVNELEERQVRLLELMKSQTNIVEKEARIMRATNNETDEIMLEINAVLQKANATIFKASLKTQIHDIFLMTNIISQKIDQTMDGITHALEHSLVSSNLMSTLNMFKLTKYYDQIAAKLPSEWQLPEYRLAENLLMKPAIQIHEEIVDFTFKIPVISRKTYRLLRLFAVPIIRDSDMVWIELNSHLMAIHENDARIPAEDSFVEIDQWNLCETSSPHVDNHKLKCELSIWFNHTIPETCLVRTTNIAETWIPVHTDTWIYALPKSEEIELGDKRIQINGTGLVLYHSEKVERINDTITLSDTSFITPAVNLTDWVVNPKPLRHRVDISKNWTKLEDDLQNLSAAENNINIWNIEHYYGIMLGFTLTVLFIVLVVICRRFSKPQEKLNHKKYFIDVV